MADETSNNEQGQQQQQAAPTGPVPGGMSDLLNGFLPVDNLVKIAEIDQQVISKKAASTPAQETPAQEEGAAAEEEGDGNEGGTEVEAGKQQQAAPTKKAGEEPAKEEKKPEAKPSKFGFGKKKDDAIVIENPDQILNVIKSKYGQELKDIKELPKFFESVDKMRVAAQKVEALEKETSNYKEILSGLPDELKLSIKDYYEGADYTKNILNKPKFDFNVPVDKQDTKALVEHYFPNEFSDADWAQEVKPKELEIAIKASQKEFVADKKAVDDKRANELAKAQKQIEAFNQSLVGSVNHLKQTFPDMAEDDFQDVKSTLEGGTAGILAHFVNKDGTLKPDAAEKLMFAVHGKEEFERMMMVASNAAETKVNEEILDRGAKGPDPNKGRGKGANNLSDEAKKKIAEFNQFKSNKTF